MSVVSILTLIALMLSWFLWSCLILV